MTMDEKKWFAGSILLIAVSTLFLLGAYVFTHHSEIPTTGGTYTEALIGSPRLINPLYASTNDVDTDLSALLYSGLLKWQPESGYKNDLADSMSVNEDQTQYTFHLRDNAKFSDGEPVQARDVVFTYTSLQNPEYRSPLRSFFQNVRIEQSDDQTVVFTLTTASASFTRYLTVGILPENLWADILAQNVPLASLNLQPIGSGPYQFKEFTKDKKGSIRSYTLKRNSRYYGEQPKIDELTFKFYPDEESSIQALTNKNVEGVGYVSFEHRATVESNHNVRTEFALIPRSTALFFNTQNAVLKNVAVRTAIANALDKNTIVKKILDSNAQALNGPLLNGFLGYDANFQANAFNPSASIDALDTAGYIKPVGATLRQIPVVAQKSSSKKSTQTSPPVVQQDLTFTLTTVSSEEFVKVANEIKAELAKVGIGITIKTIAADRLMNEVIDPQSYDLLLAASDSETDTDPYLFWHSSQIGKGGLNISHYQNKAVDALLEKARTATTDADRISAEQQFQVLLLKDTPAVFLYQSMYSYAVAKKIHLPDLSTLRIPSDRFWNVTNWYINTRKVLK